MLRVNIDGDKYTIEKTDEGQLRVLRYGEPWINAPAGSNMLISAAYELGTLRRIVAEAVRLDELIYVPNGSELLKGLTRRLHGLLAEMESYTDYRRNLTNPGEI